MAFVNTEYQLFEHTGKPFVRQQRTVSIEKDLSPGDILVQILLATICGSDLHTIEGKRVEDVPCILGHEGVGAVVAICREEEKDFSSSETCVSVGDRVTWTVADSCGLCSCCTSHKIPEKCSRLFKYGHANISKGTTGLNGCYATHIHLRKGTFVKKVPQCVSNAAVVPANCALATMMNAISKSQILQRTAAAKKGSSTPQSVVVQGGGLLGIYTCGILREMGVKRVFCMDINRCRFSMIEQFGGIPIDATNLSEATRCILNSIQSDDPQSRGVDVVFEVAGIVDLIPQGIQLLRPGGEYILVGLVHPRSVLDKVTAEQLIRKCLTVRGIHNYSPQHLSDSVDFLERNVGKFPFDALVSSAYPLGKLEDAVKEAQSQKWFRVAVQPSIEDSSIKAKL